MKRSYVSKKPKIKEEDEGKPKINNNDILSDDGKSLRVSYYLTKDIHKGGEYGFLGTLLL